MSSGPAAASRIASVRRSEGGHTAQAAAKDNSGDNQRAIIRCPLAEMQSSVLRRAIGENR